MSDAHRVYLARITHALEKISKLSDFKGLPTWVAASIKETAAQATTQVASLHTLLDTKEKPSV